MAVTAKIPFISLPTKYHVCIKSSEWGASNKGVACRKEDTPCGNAAKGVADTSSSNISERVLDEICHRVFACALTAVSL